MTRNVYLGADLGPAIEAKGIAAFTEATGEILRQVTANDFPVRAKGLAKEILSPEAGEEGQLLSHRPQPGRPSRDAALSNGQKTAWFENRAIRA
jgi:hypothetical protein